MPAETSIVRVDRPFTGGLRDAPSNQRQAAALRDGLYPLGTLVERGGWDSYAYTSSGGGNPSAVWEEVLTASGQTDPDVYVATAAALRLVTSFGRQGDVNVDNLLPLSGPGPGIHFMPGLFNGELLALPQDGETPIICTAGKLDDGEGSTSGFLTSAQVSLTDSTGGLVVSAGSGQFSSNDVGRYIWLEGLHGYRRIAQYVSGGKVVVDAVWDASVASTSGRVRAAGNLGLHTLVTDLGSTSRVGSGTTITGSNTRWNSSAVPGSGRPGYAGAYQLYQGTDIIEPVGVDYGTPLRINSISSDTSLETADAAAEFASSGAVQYVIGRPLVGKVAAVHEGRLYAAGVKWAPRRLQLSPALWNGRTSKNGEFSYEVEIGRATIVASIDVGGSGASGAITGLLSLPSGNLAILCDSEVYILWGQYPAASVRKIKDYGNFDGLSCVTVDDGAWMAGPQGVFEFAGNEPRSITEGHIDATWRRLMAEGGATACLGVIHDHLFVKVTTDLSDTTLVWHRPSRTWCGEWTLPDSIRAFYSSRRPGGPDRLLMAYDDPEVADLSTTIVDEDTPVEVTTNRGSLLARTPFDVAGSLSVEREVKYAKVEHQVVGSGATIEITTGPDGSNEQGSMGPTTGEEIASATFYPVTEVGDTTPSTLGQRTRRFDLTLERVGGNPTVTAVHELELLVKEYRHRDG